MDIMNGWFILLLESIVLIGIVCTNIDWKPKVAIKFDL